MSKDGTLQRKTVRSGVLVGLTSLIINSLTFIRTIILARLLAPEIFGLLSICFIVIKGVEIFTETGFGAALIYKRDGFEKARDTAFTMTVIRGCLLAVCVFFLSPLVSGYYEKPVLENLLKVMTLVLVFHGFQNINMIALQKELDFRRIALLEQAKALSASVILIGLAYYRGDVWALVLGYVAVAAMDSLLSFTIIPGWPSFRFNLGIARELFSYGKFITGLSIVVFIAGEIDNAIVGKVLGMEVLGYYVLAFTLANLPTTHISKIASRVMFPSYSKLQNDLPALREAYLKVLKLVATVAVPASVGIAVLSQEIVNVLYGARWLPAAGPLRVLCAYGCIMAVMSLNGYIFNAIGKPKIPFYFNAARLILISIIIYPMVVRFGLYGAALAITIPLFMQFILITVVFSRTVGVRISKIGGQLLTVGLCSAIMAVALLFLKEVLPEPNPYTLSLSIALGFFIYALFNLTELKALFQKVRMGLS